MIFSRSRGNAGRHTSDAQARDAKTRDAKGRHAKGRDVPTDDERALDEESDATRDFGPYDLSEAPDDDIERLDLGALRIPAIAGVEIQLQAGSDGQVQQVMLVHDDSKLQLGVFAAPRTEGIWDEVRAMLRTSMAQNGARQEDTTGDYGPELKARVRDGSSHVDLRHIGVDGPRWFVHAVFIGAAAADPTRAGPLLGVLRGLVVDRGMDARPVREALPLRLPPQAAAQLAAQGDEAAVAGAAAKPSSARSAGSDGGGADATGTGGGGARANGRSGGRSGADRGGSAGRRAGRQA